MRQDFTCRGVVTDFYIFNSGELQRLRSQHYDATVGAGKEIESRGCGLVDDAAAVNYGDFWGRTVPEAHVEARIVGKHRGGCGEDGVVKGALAVYESRVERGGEFECGLRRVAQGVHVAVGALSPFEGDERPLQGVGGEETGIEASSFVFEHTLGHFDAGVTEHGYAASADFGKGVAAGYHHTRYAAVDDELGARGRLAIVGAGLESDIYGGGGEQMTVSLSDRAHGVDLGMGLAATAVVALPYYPVAGHDDSAYVGVGVSVEWR